MHYSSISCANSFPCLLRESFKRKNSVSPIGSYPPSPGAVWTCWAFLFESLVPLPLASGVWWGSPILCKGVPSSWRHHILRTEGETLGRVRQLNMGKKFFCTNLRKEMWIYSGIDSQAQAGRLVPNILRKNNAHFGMICSFVQMELGSFLHCSGDWVAILWGVLISGCCLSHIVSCFFSSACILIWVVCSCYMETFWLLVHRSPDLDFQVWAKLGFSKSNFYPYVRVQAGFPYPQGSCTHPLSWICRKGLS